MDDFENKLLDIIYKNFTYHEINSFAHHYLKSDDDVNRFIETILKNGNQIQLDNICSIIQDVKPNMFPCVLIRLAHDKRYNIEIVSLLSNYIDIIIEYANENDLYYIKDIVKNKKDAYDKVVQKMKDITKEKVIKWLRALYLRVIISHSYYHDLSYLNQKKFTDILEIIYLIIEDVCKNENIAITDIKNIGNGAYSSVLLIGSKVIKIGLQRATSTFPNNPYINAILLRKKFPITNTETFFVEVNERVDNQCEIMDEELYHLYKKMRDIHLIWLDVEKRNVGRLLRDNHVYWRNELPITDEVLGLDTYRGNDLLKKGELVILDNDLIYDENCSYLINQSSTPLQKEFEKRYQREKVLHKEVEN